MGLTDDRTSTLHVLERLLQIVDRLGEAVHKLQVVRFRYVCEGVVLLLLLGLLRVHSRLLLLVRKTGRRGTSRCVMYCGTSSGRTRRVMVRKMCIVLVLLLLLQLLLMLRALELLLLLLLHVRRVVMRAGRLLLAVVAMLHLHVMVKTCGGTTGMGMVLFLEILLLVVNGLRRRLLLVVVVLGCHLLLHVSLRDLSGLLLLLIRCRMLGVWWNNVIRLLVGAVVANQLQVRQNVANVVVGASRNVRAASVILLLLLLLLVFHFDHVGVPNFL